MFFLHPLFLLAAAALAGPLIMHLLMRDRAQRQILPTMRFLPLSSVQSMSRHKIKNLLLLLLRLAILLFLVLAFSRPYFGQKQGAGATKSVDEGDVFAVDTSLSMRAKGHWDDALNQTLALARNMPGDSHFAVILFDRTARVALTESDDRVKLETALREARPGMGGTDLIAAVRTASEAAAKIKAKRRRVYLISDFQDSGFRQIAMDLEMPKGVELVPVRIGDESGKNAAIQSMAEQPSAKAGVRCVRVQVQNFGLKEAKGSLGLFDGEKMLVAKDVALAEDAPFVADFELAMKPEDELVLTAKLELKDELMDDNEFVYAMKAQKPLPVLAIVRSGEVKIGKNEQNNLPLKGNPYLKAGILACEGRITAQWVDPSEIAGAAIEKNPVAIMDQGKEDLADALPAVLNYVRAGGVLIYFPSKGSPEPFESLSGAKTEGWTDLDAAAGNFRLVSSSSTQGATALLSGTGSTLLGYPRAFSYLKVKENPAQGLRAVMQLDDGSPFLLERKLDKGVIYLFTVSLDPRASDLVLRAAFPPFIFQLLQQGVKHSEQKTEFVVGDLFTPVESQKAELAALTGPDKKETSLAKERPRLERPGLYWLRMGGVKQPVTVRIDEKESDLKLMDKGRINQLARVGQGAVLADNGSGFVPLSEPTPDPDAQWRFWRILLLGALLIMATETLLASRTCR